MTLPPPRRASTATARARTSASGAARPRPAPAASTARPAGMRSEVDLERIGKESLKMKFKLAKKVPIVDRVGGRMVFKEGVQTRPTEGLGKKEIGK